MMLGFYRRFGGLVWEGSKTHTIRIGRADGKVPRIGETLHCFVDSRQKTMGRLGNWICTKVETIHVACPESVRVRVREFVAHRPAMEYLQIDVDGHRLDLAELNMLAWRDGFRETTPPAAYAEFEYYWVKRARGKRAFPNDGHIIHWQFDAAPVLAKPSTMRERKALGRAPLPNILEAPAP